MRPAAAPRSAKDLRVLVVAPGESGFETESMRVVSSLDLASLFEPGDLLVVNDAATLPASLPAKTDLGEEIELRLVTSIGEREWTVALFGSGGYRTRTEDRPPPPALAAGDRVFARSGIVATVTRIHPESPRLIDVSLSIHGRADPSLAEIWSALYRAGDPVQYAHVPEPLALWDVQNVFASRPWAVEMPSAGRALRVETLLELHARGVEIATVTHAAGLSSIGDATLDELLPLPERYETTERTWEAIARARTRGGRVVAIGTSAARALEGSVRAGRRSGVTDLKIGHDTRRAIVDAVLTGLHDAGTSHFTLLEAFVSKTTLACALDRASSEGLLGHEMGDACLVWGQPRDKLGEGRLLGRVASRERSREVARARGPAEARAVL